jgi:hypothetical protein
MPTLFMAALGTEEEHVLMLTLFMAASQTEEEHLLMLTLLWPPRRRKRSTC